VEHIHLPSDVKILFYVAVASGLILLFYFYFWIAVAGVISLAFWKFFTRRGSLIDNKIVARLFRQRDDKLQGYVLPIREEVSPKNYDIIASIEGVNLKHLLFGGAGGSGKSFALLWFLWQYTNPDECQRNGIEPCVAYAFNVKPHPKGKGDFENIEFRYFNLLNNLPDFFNEEYKTELVLTFACIYTSVLTSVGIMANAMPNFFGNILDYKPCKSIRDVINNALQLANTSTGLNQQLYSFIALKMKELDVGTQNEIEFDWNVSTILDVSFIPTPLGQNFVIEMYSRIITKKAMQEHREGRSHRIILCVDEAARLLKHGAFSILSVALREGRAGMRLFLGTQTPAIDILQGDEHYQWFQFRTSNSNDIQRIQTLSPLHAEAVRLLREHEFVWVNDGQSQSIPIFKIDGTRLKEFRKVHPQVYPSEKVETRKEITETKDVIVEEKTEETLRFDREKAENEIRKVIAESGTGLFISEILTRIGYGDRNHRHRGDAFRLIKKMGKDGKIRIEDYISSDGREHKLCLDSKSEDHKETQMHRKILSDIYNNVKKEGWQYVEGKINQGWDGWIEELRVYIDAKTGYEHTLGNDIPRLRDENVTKKDWLVIFVCPNDAVKQKYLEGLGDVKGIENRWKVCLLSELAQVLWSLKK
jgi:hypothetical protein